MGLTFSSAISRELFVFSIFGKDSQLLKNLSALATSMIQKGIEEDLGKFCVCIVVKGITHKSSRNLRFD